MVKDETRKNKPILLVGNGINRLFMNDSDYFDVETLLKANRKNYKKCNKNDEYLRFPMKISANYNGNEDDASAVVKGFLVDKMDISKEKKKFISELLNLQVGTILTTNYSFEFEKIIIPNISVGKIKNRYGYGKEGSLREKEKELGIYQFIKLDENKNLWHIHGIATRKKSIVLGQYNYAFLLSEVIRYTSGLLSRWNSKNSFYYHSWIDYFVTSDVHILGFAFDLAEIDLWWLLAFKKRHFPFRKVYFYSKSGDLNNGVRTMLCTYDVNLVEIATKNFEEFYKIASEKIKENLKKI